MNAQQIEARRWFIQAQADLAVVRTLRTEGHYAAACFHAQQAAEKALRAVLFSQGSWVWSGDTRCGNWPGSVRRTIVPLPGCLGMRRY